ncbi:hypothetical protein [Synechococcus sp. CS-205]|uniref:hypothetical protein n=1 Tax=Synechococcus sp. CS-205 TaxID=2847984 RepID=UPI00223B903F|nr:hypothetical protein [Synechococcus sp. CS-205]MCT0248954.1 hypothetical protein [Synechococcus sp. CS-205]
MHSVLERVSRAEIRYDPFVHLVIQNCLPQDYYQKLAASYPSDAPAAALGLRQRLRRKLASAARRLSGRD